MDMMILGVLSEVKCMTLVYVILVILAIILFGIAFYIGKLQKKISERKALLRTMTKEIEILDEFPKKNSSDEENPIIVSSTFLEESLEDEEEL